MAIDIDDIVDVADQLYWAEQSPAARKAIRIATQAMAGKRTAVALAVLAMAIAFAYGVATGAPIVSIALVAAVAFIAGAIISLLFRR